MTIRFRNLLVISLLVWLSACTPKEQLTAVFNIDDRTISNHQVEETIKVLTRRLSLLKATNDRVLFDAERKQITIQSNLLTTKMQFDFLMIPGRVVIPPVK
jgi:ABC-type uncharacterized transport system auxiliary subunit